MKNVYRAALILIVVSVALGGLSCKKKSTFGELLIEVESSMQSESMEREKWPQRKVSWEQDVKNAQNDVGVLKKLLVEFETSILYGAQKPNWRDRREGWLSSVSNAGSISNLRDLLMELEGSFTFSTQQADWQEKRGDWIRRLQDLQ